MTRAFIIQELSKVAVGYWMDSPEGRQRAAQALRDAADHVEEGGSVT